MMQNFFEVSLVFFEDEKTELQMSGFVILQKILFFISQISCVKFIAEFNNVLKNCVSAILFE